MNSEFWQAVGVVFTAVVTSVVTWWSKGRFEKRTLNADTSKKEVDTYGELMHSVEQRFAQMHETIFDLQAKVSALTMEMQGLKSENKQLKLENKTLKSQQKSLRDENDDLQGELKRLSNLINED